MINNLISRIASLPGLGPKSAKRIVIHLMKNNNNITDSLLKLISQLLNSIKLCKICGNIDESNPCKICLEDQRDRSTICIVKDIGDLWAFEQSGIYKGLYHILGENLSSNSPEELDKSISSLENRITSSNIMYEIIIAASPTIEGQITSHYIFDVLQKYNLKITTLGCGIPIGGEIDYMDEGTLSAALTSRKEFS